MIKPTSIMTAQDLSVYTVMRSAFYLPCIPKKRSSTNPLNPFTEALLVDLRTTDVTTAFSNIVKAMYTKFPDKGVQHVNNIRRQEMACHVARRIIALNLEALYPVLLHLYNNGFLHAKSIVDSEFVVFMWDNLPNDRDVIGANANIFDTHVIMMLE